MAKQQRMVTLAVAALAAAVETALALPPRILPAALVGIAALALLTAARRALATVRFLERR
jgi:apolipoprotein N-acyltransferase